MGPFLSIWGPGRAKNVFPSPMVIHFGGFWEDFGAVWEPFGNPKVRKRGPKSIPEIIRILMSIFNDCWMVWESTKHGFGSGHLGGTRFLARLVFG